MKTDRTDRELMIGLLTVYVAVIGLALVIGLAWRVFHWAAGL
jgi:hypothetical protein